MSPIADHVQLPLTLLIKKVGPNILLPTLVVLWGIVTTFQGFVHDYHGLLIARFFLGCTEGAILPSSMAYLSTFYRRGDLAKRVALFFSATSLAGAFSGLLASAILNMAGIRGMKGWQWLFIIEGIFTCVYGFIAFAILPRAPTTAWFLSQPEKDALVAALAVDRPPAEDEQKLTLRAVLDVFSAPHMWNMALQFFSSGAMLYASAYFAPTIVGAIGYKGIKVQLYSVPPYVCSAAFALGSCWLSDYLKLRGPFIMLAAIVSVIGYAMFLGSTNPKTLYAALFLQVMGAYAVAPLQSTWMREFLKLNRKLTCQPTTWLPSTGESPASPWALSPPTREVFSALGCSRPTRRHATTAAPLSSSASRQQSASGRSSICSTCTTKTGSVQLPMVWKRTTRTSTTASWATAASTSSTFFSVPQNYRTVNATLMSVFYKRPIRLLGTPQYSE